MHVMNPEQRDRFQQRLEQLRRELLDTADAAAQAARTVELDQARMGRLSRMDAMQEQAMAVAWQQRREMQSRRIEAALARMASGDYGVCQCCGEDINIRRLELDPTLPLCIECAAAEEKS